MAKDPFLQAAVEQARKSLSEGGIPIGSVLVHQGRIIGQGHNCRVQTGSPIDHGEMNCLRNAGRLSANAFTIADLSHVWIICDVYENNLPLVHLGQKADIRLTAYPDRILTGVVSDIGAEVPR